MPGQGYGLTESAGAGTITEGQCAQRRVRLERAAAGGLGVGDRKRVVKVFICVAEYW